MTIYGFPFPQSFITFDKHIDEDGEGLCMLHRFACPQFKQKMFFAIDLRQLWGSDTELTWLCDFKKLELRNIIIFYLCIVKVPVLLRRCHKNRISLDYQ